MKKNGKIMSLQRFTILKSADQGQVDGLDYPQLLNIDHISSIKPIKIMYQGNIINGFWIRMSNDKKYKATQIPKDLLDRLLDEGQLTERSVNHDVDTTDPMSFVEL